MAYMRNWHRFLFDDVTHDLVGYKDDDGGEFYFQRVPHYGQFMATGDQTALANTETPMGFDVIDVGEGLATRDSNKIVSTRDAVYNIQFSAQITNPTNDDHNISIWLAKDGAPVADSNTELTIVKTHAGGDGHMVAAWNWLLRLDAGEYAQIMWSTPNAGVYLESKLVQTSPVRPATPSVIITVTEVAA